jgi:3-oxoacyl-[acyl-carrier protein] reductase
MRKLPNQLTVDIVAPGVEIFDICDNTWAHKRLHDLTRCYDVGDCGNGPLEIKSRQQRRSLGTSYNLVGRTALVTGGASGIGLATVELLARSGATVAVNFLSYDSRGPAIVAKLASEGVKVSSAPGDVSSEQEAESMVGRAIDSLGRLDLLVNNAGPPARTKSIAADQFDLVTERLWRTLVDTNLVSVFRCSRAARHALTSSGGAIVSTASLSGFDSVGSSIAYAATKAGVINLTKNLARALAPHVRVNAVAPGAVDSTWMVEWSDEQRRSLRCSSDDACLKIWRERSRFSDSRHP